MKETWKEFASNTTLHGLRHVVSVRSNVRRTVWILCLLTCTAAYLYLFSESIITFWNRPIRTEISHEFPEDGTDFPVITICNLNRFVKSKINMPYYNAQFYKQNLNMSVCATIRSVIGNLTCGQALLCAFEQFGSSVVDGCSEDKRSRIIAAVNRSDRPFNPEEFLFRYGHDFAPMLVRYCRFSGEEDGLVCNASDWQPIITENGLCHSFNKDSSLKIYYSGGSGGLNIILDAQTEENTYSEFSLGFQIVVSAKDTFINRYRGINAPPGSHTLVAITPRKFIRLPAPYKTNCSDHKLLGSSVYTKDACIGDCTTNATIRHCGCRIVGVPGLPDVPVCSIQDIDCVLKTRERIKSSLCHCSVPCYEEYYEPSVSYSKFPDVTVIKVFKNFFKMNKTVEYLRENLVFLQVGFVELAYQIDKQVPSYGMASLLGDIGGNMGLLLGCSVLTLVEFVDYLWIAIVGRIFNKNTTIEHRPNEGDKPRTNSPSIENWHQV